MNDLENVEASENISEGESEDIHTRTIKSIMKLLIGTSNVQTKSLSKSFS